MTTTYEVPTSPNPQTFSITLNAVTYVFTLKWNTIASAWILNIADANNNPILSGIPLVTGVDLLEQYGYLNFGGYLTAQTDNALQVPPTFTDLGITGHLYFTTP